MKIIKNRAVGGFTLIELLIVIAIIGILAGVATPAYNGIRQSGLRAKDVNNVRQILLGLRVYSSEFDGIYPNATRASDGSVAEFSTSTDAFNVLYPDYIDTKQVFWMPTKKYSLPPVENGLELLPAENFYGYAAGQSDSGFSTSPLVFDGMMSKTGEMTSEHPWLSKKKAVIGFVDGHIEQLPLTTADAGATIQRARGDAMKNIFEVRPTGLLEDGANVLLPQ